MYKEEKVYARRTTSIDGETCYYLSFKDSVGSIVEVEVDAYVYEAIREFELAEARIAWSDRMHLERLLLTDEEIDIRAGREHDTVEKTLIMQLCCEEVAEAIFGLTTTQQRRFLLHRGRGMTLKEISKKEGVSISVVHHSVKQTERKLKKTIKSFLNTMGEN